MAIIAPSHDQFDFGNVASRSVKISQIFPELFGMERSDSLCKTIFMWKEKIIVNKLFSFANQSDEESQTLVLFLNKAKGGDINRNRVDVEPKPSADL
ncbi:hypothetical protein RJT34_20339 [Clitoria ternatea]|uniref:Uncharacterized protein n=1 Tax=Clitoria ternatea TaxID=43366 RepID=A0AAN9ITA7_CLITE